MGMITLLSAVGSLLSFRVRSRAALELELVALRHQVTVLRRHHPGRPRLFSADRLLWVWLYRIWPQVLDAMVLVKPATVLAWHLKGFRLYWRRRSRHLGRPGTSREIPYGQIIGPAVGPSRRLTMIVAQKPAQSLAAASRPVAAAVRVPRKQQDVALPLVVPLGVKMVDVFAQRPSQRALAEQDPANSAR